MCQGLGPKKHDEISEIDRIYLEGRSQWGVPWKGVIISVFVFYCVFVCVYVWLYPNPRICESTNLKSANPRIPKHLNPPFAAEIVSMDRRNKFPIILLKGGLGVKIQAPFCDTRVEIT